MTFPVKECTFFILFNLIIFLFQSTYVISLEVLSLSFSSDSTHKYISALIYSSSLKYKKWHKIIFKKKNYIPSSSFLLVFLAEDSFKMLQLTGWVWAEGEERRCWKEVLYKWTFVCLFSRLGLTDLLLQPRLARRGVEDWAARTASLGFLHARRRWTKQLLYRGK